MAKVANTTEAGSTLYQVALLEWERSSLVRQNIASNGSRLNVPSDGRSYGALTA